MFRAASDSSPLTTKCEVAITQMIQRGTLRPGEKLSELGLVRRLKMGKAPVRSALDRLAAIGLVERLPRSGTFVRQLSIREYCDLIDVRAVMEGLAARLACRHLTKEKLTKLERLAAAFDRQNNEQRSGSVKFARSVDLDLRFHLELAELSQNSQIIQLLYSQRLLEKSLLVALGVAPGLRTLPVGPTHTMIVEAMRLPDPALAEQRMIEHIVQAKEASIRGIATPFGAQPKKAVS